MLSAPEQRCGVKGGETRSWLPGWLSCIPVSTQPCFKTTFRYRAQAFRAVRKIHLQLLVILNWIQSCIEWGKDVGFKISYMFTPFIKRFYLFFSTHFHFKPILFRRVFIFEPQLLSFPFLLSLTSVKQWIWMPSYGATKESVLFHPS